MAIKTSFPQRVYINEGDEITFDENRGYVLERSDEYIVFKFPGRSVYSNSIGGVSYQPTRLFFGHISDYGENYVEVDDGLYVPSR